MKSPKSKLSRRNFLVVVGASGIAAAATLVTHQNPDAQPGTQVKDSGSQSYRLTEHIQNYYRTAKV
ncbi:MAG: twin-arginine translocation signal domain-containing protein [Burkholderiales bacterium]|nr:twin-arginine translocation signal domain-containing protein [Burkholderiales bacterium]